MLRNQLIASGMQIRGVPHRHHHKLIEFYDVRAAEAALRALSMSELEGKLELRHPDCNPW